MFTRIISQPLGLEKLRSILPEDSKAVLYESLRGKKRGTLFKHITSLVVLYETKIDGKKQGHWVCLIPRAHSLEYFSSLGRSPTDEMNALHVNPTVFTDLLGKNYTYNRKKLQLDSYTVEDCGYWVVARAILHELKLPAFQRLFTPRSLRSSDEVLAVMSALLANR
jgi:hypothetical protein